MIRNVRFDADRLARTELENAQSGISYKVQEGIHVQDASFAMHIVPLISVFSRDAQPQVFYLHDTASSFSLCRNLLAFTGSSLSSLFA